MKTQLTVPLALTLASFGLLCLAPDSAQAQGLLLPTEPGLGALSIGHQRIKISIVDGTAVTKVDQTFVNHTGRQLEATYLFPLPKGAALQDFALWIGGKKQKGEVLEKQKARSIYEGIVRQMKDPGLLEYVDHDLFRARVFPVPAHGAQRIEISFSQILKFQEGVYTYRYPLGAARVQNARSRRTLKDFTVTASVRSKVPIKSVYSPSHRVDVRRPSEHAAELGFEKLRERLDRDLLLYYTVGQGDVGVNLLTHAPAGEPGYFLMMVSPKQAWQQDEVVGKTVTFVVDTSGSMARKKLNSAKKALRYCLKRLLPEDRFNIVRFSTSVEPFRRRPIAASEKNVSAAERFVKGFYSSGGTAIYEALQTALRDRPEDGGPHLVVFLTDGEPTVGITDVKTIAQSIQSSNTGHSRIFAFGVGSELNATLLDRLASESGASVEYAHDGKETEAKVSGFYNRIAFPVLSDVAVNLEEAGAYDIYPRERPALFKGEQLIVVGRYREPGKHTVTLSGSAGKVRKTFDETVDFPASDPEHAFIAKLWAVRKVGYLLEEIRAHGLQSELRDEVIRLGKRFGIVTPYTSYLVLDDRRPTPSPFTTRNRSSGGPVDRPRPAMQRPASADAPSESPRKSRSRPMMETMASGRGFSESTGADAIAVSKAVKAMKEKKSADTDETALNQRYASGRNFQLRGGLWTDTRWDSKLPTLKIKALSEAYFELLRLHPTLKQALSLGARLKIRIDSTHAVIIDQEGQSTRASVQAFFKGSAGK